MYVPPIRMAFIQGLPSFISGVTQQEVHPIIIVHEIVAMLA